MNIINRLKNIIDSNQSIALVTITKDNGSAPRGIGSMMLVSSDGLLDGSVGGGALEYKCIEDAKLALTEKVSKSISYPLSDLNMTCGGDVEIFIQVFNSKDEVLIVGAGHISKALIPLFKSLDFKLTVLDHRDNIFEDQIFKSCHTINDDIESALKSYKFHNDLYIIIVTHGHVHDEIALELSLKQAHQYIGMIGSQSKIKNCFNNLLEKGVSKSQLQSVYAPIGLTLGGETPEAIALSIVSEIQALKHNMMPQHYKNTKDII